VGVPGSRVGEGGASEVGDAGEVESRERPPVMVTMEGKAGAPQ
jgi:hypothetical protein